jgi:ferredoxin
LHFFKKTIDFSRKYDRIYIDQNIWRYFTMAYKISDECIACGACADACPVGCISEGDGKYVINGDECVSCGSCADACPVGAPAEE